MADLLVPFLLAFGVAACVAGIVCLVVNTPSRDEISDAVMREHLRDYKANADARRRRRAAREAEDAKRNAND